MSRSPGTIASRISSALTMGYIWHALESWADRKAPNDAWCGPPKRSSSEAPPAGDESTKR